MKKLLFTLTLALPLLGNGTAVGQKTRCNEEKQLPGAYLKWIKIAEPVFRSKHLNLNDYNIEFLEEPDSIAVMFTSTDATCEGFGSTGSRPDFAVTINKKSMKVMHSEYAR